MTESLDPATVAAAHGWKSPSGRLRAVAVPYSRIRRERVEWLVPGRIPLSAVSMLAGEPGLGKSLYSVALAARLSRGGVSSLLLSAEDSEGATIRPRLDACKADAELVHSVRLVGSDDGDGEGLSLPADVSELDRLIGETGARLVVVDPIVAFLDGGIDSHKDASVRQALAPLARIADTRRCAVLAVLHVNKATGSDWYRRLSGSGGFGGAARSVLLFGRDPDDEDAERGTARLLAHAKCNVAELAPSERWTLAPILLPASGDEPETRTARLELVGECEHSYRVLLDTSSDPDERAPRDEARDFLRAELYAGPRPVKDVERAARDAGIAPRTLQRARASLGVKSRKSGFHGGWEWELLTKDANPGEEDSEDDEWHPSPQPPGYGDSGPSSTPETAEGSHVLDVALFDADDLESDLGRARRTHPDLAGEDAA